MKKIILLLTGSVFVLTGFSQSLFTNTNFQNAVKRGTRTENGLPGKNYWQNQANYSIRVTFDPATQELKGEETISYFNNSPDTLKEMIIRLYPDLYKKGVARESHIAEKDLGSGVQITYFKIGDEQITDFNNRRKAFHDNTNLFIRPANPVLPRTEQKLQVHWNYKVNTGSNVRTGMVDSGSYFIAYFYPRVAVYDDIDGWDTWSYNGSQEFYNDFGDFNVSIQLPKGYVVWATGDRMNAADNFSENILNKIKEASVSNKIIDVIDSNDLEQNRVIKPDANGLWKFQASHVTDFAFALSNHYLWKVSSVIVDSATGRRTTAEAAFNPKHKDYFDVADQARQTVYYTSHYYPKYPFPFPHITVFDGTDQMEYPMMCNDNPLPDRKDAVQLTTHEIFHSYFPFFMGTNETQDSWMDEGWATIGESVLSPLMGEPEDDGIFSKTRFVNVSGTDQNVPLITNTKLYSGLPYLANSYGKPGVCYYVLQQLLGDVLYFKGLHHYMDVWHGKHPNQYDFFYSFNEGTGKNLDWFWKKWFFGWDFPEMSVEARRTKTGPASVVVKNGGGLPLPVVLTYQLKNGKSIVKKYSPEVWKNNPDVFRVISPAKYSEIQAVTLGSDLIPDKFPQNNVVELK